MEKNLKLFEDKDVENTEDTLEAVGERIEELDIDHVVVATTSGETGAKAVRYFEDQDVEVVVVSHQYGYSEPGEVELEDEHRRTIEDAGNSSLVFTPDILTRIPKIVRKKYGGGSELDLISDTLRMVSQGTKVCIECTVQAADSGNIPVDEEIAAIAGTVEGADTGLILESQHSQDIFDIDIKEIVCMPRDG